MYKWIGFLAILFSISVQGQELNCTVKISFDRITDASPQVFQVLEKSLNDFMNNTRFTTRNVGRNERISCAMFFNISAYDSGNFTATLQITSSRPVYNATYTTTVFNYNDKDVVFRYNQGDNLLYNPTTFDSNLVSLVSFYANMIIGLDADTFKPNGGTPYYEVAQDITSVAQSSGYKGWSQQDGNQSRFYLANDITNNTFEPIREALYSYHREGLDVMADDAKGGKDKIVAAIKNINNVQKVRPNAFLTRVFFDAKADEIAGVFSGGPQVNTGEILDLLNRMSPNNSSKWNTIK